MQEKNTKVDGYIRKNDRWGLELTALREIVLECDLKEEIKWRSPCYTAEGGNIAIMQVFNDYCALMFPKGVLLKDPAGALIQLTKNTQAARQLRFTSVDEVVEMENVIKAYLKEAVAVEKAGLKVPFKSTDEFDMPDEFRERLDEMPELQAAFDGLTPGRQRGYLLYFSGAKRSATRAARVEKHIPRILTGKGLND